MQRLILMRHAEAERAAGSGRDRDRILSARGRRDAAAMGRADAADLADDAASPVDVLRRAIADEEGGSPYDPLPARAPAPEDTPDVESIAAAVETFDPARFTDGTASPAVQAADDALEAELAARFAASAPKPDPNNPKLIYTRGQGVRYHGATRPIDKLQDDYVGSDKNIYGQGFYTSDAVSITDGYSRAKGSKTGVIYRVEETGPINALDMEQPVPDWLRSDLEKDTDGITGDLIQEALDENPANLREFYDAVRTLSPLTLFDVVTRDFGSSSVRR
jgi:hypothetical protein